MDNYNKSKKNTFFQTRMDVLENNIDKHIRRIEHAENIDFVEIHYLCYDEN